MGAVASVGTTGEGHGHPGGEAPAPAASTGPQIGKSGKKICCACPATRKLRDACVVEKGPESCKAEIEAHTACLREDGFRV